MSNTATFIGHFDIGEKVTDNKNQLNYFKNVENVCLLVGDIGLEDKLITYMQRGLLGLKTIYRKRYADCTSICTLQQLPKNNDEISARIDVEQYEFFKDFLIIQNKEIYDKIINDENLTIEETIEFQSLIKYKYIPVIIEKKYKGHLPKNVRIVTEKLLRNRVGKRIKHTHNNSLVKLPGYSKRTSGIYIDDEKIADQNNSPICRGIMMIFYEFMTLQGFNKINHYLEKRHLRSIYLGWTLFKDNMKSIIKNKTITTSFNIFGDNGLAIPLTEVDIEKLIYK